MGEFPHKLTDQIRNQTELQHPSEKLGWKDCLNVIDLLESQGTVLEQDTQIGKDKISSCFKQSGLPVGDYTKYEHGFLEALHKYLNSKYK